MTRRPQNKCHACGSTWYPRGGDLSPRCPRCQSANVGYAPSYGCWIALACLAAVALLVAAGCVASLLRGPGSRTVAPPQKADEKKPVPPEVRKDDRPGPTKKKHSREDFLEQAGKGKDAVRRALGEPDSITPDGDHEFWRYEKSNGGTALLRFDTRTGRLLDMAFE